MKSKAEELKSLQAPIKECYRQEPKAAMITLCAEGKCEVALKGFDNPIRAHAVDWASDVTTA